MPTASEVGAATKAYVDEAVANADNYTLPAATASTIGGVKPGTNLTVAADGTLNATAGGLATTSPDGKARLNWFSNTGRLNFSEGDIGLGLFVNTDNTTTLQSTIYNGSTELNQLTIQASRVLFTETIVGQKQPTVVSGIKTPTSEYDAANKAYVDAKFAELAALLKPDEPDRN